jgi:retinol dehydrogenase 12
MATVVVTGATGAVGSAVVAELEARRAQVVRLSRPQVDLSSMASVRAAAGELNRAGVHVDALLHIASVYSPRYQRSADGFEVMFATNHLGPFLLTNLLRDRLARGGRVITVTAPSTTAVDIDRLLDRDHFSAMHSFGATRAANLMFTFELAHRGKRWDVRANAFHPGVVRSRLTREAPRRARVATRLFGSDARRPASDLVDLALSPAFAGTSGWFFKGGGRIDAPRHTQDPASQAALWKASSELVELDGGF